MNARVRDRGPFRRVWIQPAAGDADTAPGAAVWVDAMERGGDERPFVMDHAYLGSSFDDAEIEEFLKWSKLSYRRLDSVAQETAEILARQGDRLVSGEDGIRSPGAGGSFDFGLADPSGYARAAQRN